MDEPDSNLYFGNQVREKIVQLKQLGLSILFHQYKTITNGEPKQTLTVKNLATIYQLDEQLLRKNLRTIYE
ncbi:ABC transporter ATP-binding protein [Pasteurella multocida]|nr:ABC transporter ATP-binding protein [Pasteurella multocida]